MPGYNCFSVTTHSINPPHQETLVNDKIGALALAIATTIGAGVLGLPKALYLVGPLGLVIAALVAFFLLISAVMLSDMLKREKRPIQIPALIADVLGACFLLLGAI